MAETIQDRIEILEAKLSVAVPAANDADEDRIAVAVGLASCYAFKDDLVRAGAAMEKVRDVQPSSLWAKSAKLYTEGMLMLRKSKAQVFSARAKFNQIDREDPTFALHKLGFAYMHTLKGEYEQAFTLYRAVLADLGDYAPPCTRVGIAVCALKLDRIAYARKCLERALQVDDTDVLALRALFVVCCRLRDLPTVSEVIIKLFRLNNDDPLVLLRYVDTLFLKAEQEHELSKYAGAQLNLIEQAESIARDRKDTALVGYAQFQRGRLFEVGRDYARAKDSYTTALKDYKELFPAKVGLARVLHELGDTKKCFDLLIELEREEPDDSNVLAMLIRTYSDQGQFDCAQRLAIRFVKTAAPADPEASFLAAYASRLDSRQISKYLKVATELLQSENEPIPWTVRADLASIQDNVNSIAEVVTEVFKTNDVAELCKMPAVELEHLPLLYDYARLTMVADPTGTRKLLLHLVKHHPGALDTFYLLHELALQEKRPREAVAWLNVLLKLDPTATHASVLLSRLYLESKASSAALRRAYDILQKSTATRKDHVMQLAKALLLLREGQRPDRQQQLIPAIQRFAEVLKDDPRNLTAAHGLACCTALRGDANEACRMLDRIAETASNDSTSKDNALVHQLIAHIQSGNTPHAVSLARTLRIETASIRHRSSIAYAYLCSGQFNQAREILEKAKEALLSHPPSAQDEGLLSMLNYDLTIVTVCGVVERLAKPEKLDLAKLEDMKNDIRAALEMAKVAASSNYKRDAGTSILFMNDIISQLKNLEKERLRQVQRAKRHKVQDEQLTGEWRRQAEEARAQRNLESQTAMERKEALRRARLEAANAFQENTRRMNPTQEEVGYRERDEYADGAMTPDVEPIDQGELMDESAIGLEHSLLDALENPHFVGGTINVNETLLPETMDPINATQIGLDGA